MEEFICEQLNHQLAGDGANEVEEERMMNFVQAALAASSRMSQEADRSLQRLQELHSEMGTERINAWIGEHVAEIATSPPMPATDHVDDSFSLAYATTNGYHTEEDTQRD